MLVFYQNKCNLDIIDYALQNITAPKNTLQVYTYYIISNCITLKVNSGTASQIEEWYITLDLCNRIDPTESYERLTCNIESGRRVVESCQKSLQSFC